MSTLPEIDFILAPLDFLGDPKRNAPLGVLSLAAITEKAGYPTRVTDLRDCSLDESLARIRPSDIYAFSATTPEYPVCRLLAAGIKQKYPGSLILLGGVHATVCADRIDPVFDGVARGEGESVILEILKAALRPDRPRVWSSRGWADVNELPWPARHLLPRDSFVSLSLVEKGRPATTLLASRGCAFDCSFCASKVMWDRRCRYRSVDNVMSEIHMLKETYGVEQLRFQDDDLAINKRWLFDLCARMKPLKMVWRTNVRVDNSGPDVLSAMKEGGCDEVCYGIESPEQEVLDKCRKKERIEHAHEAIRSAHDLGLKVRIFLIIGLPGQGEKVAEHMIDFIKTTRPTAVDLSTFVPFPGSDIYCHPEHYGISLRRDIDFSDYVMTRGLYGEERAKDFVFCHDILSNEQLKDRRAQVLDFIQSYHLVQNK